MSEERNRDLFGEKPDARQGGGAKPGRFANRDRHLTTDELELVDAIKAAASGLASLYEKAPAGRHTSIAMTELETSILWVVKGICA